MTCHLPPTVKNILSPVILVMPDGTTKKYLSGKRAAKKTFEKLYGISTVRVVGKAIELTLYAEEFSPELSGKEQGFF